MTAFMVVGRAIVDKFDNRGLITFTSQRHATQDTECTLPQRSADRYLVVLVQRELNRESRQ